MSRSALRSDGTVVLAGWAHDPTRGTNPPHVRLVVDETVVSEFDAAGVRPDVAAAILYPYVSEANHWMIKHHGIFQGYNFFHHLGMDRNMRDGFRDSPYYDYTAEFIAKYDDPAFDADKPRLELELFAPLVRRVFAKPVNTIYKTLK